MNKNVNVLDVLGCVQVIDLEELDTQDFIPAIGGMLIIKILHDYISPISCTHEGCFELADVMVVTISKLGEAQDMVCQLCEEHLEEVRELTEREIPMMRMN